jgi:hypothetical protein
MMHGQKTIKLRNIAVAYRVTVKAFRPFVGTLKFRDRVYKSPAADLTLSHWIHSVYPYHL